MPARRTPRPAAGAAIVFALLTILLVPTLARAAPLIRPWVPPGTDSLTVWAAEARERFQANAGDSVGGRNFRAYDLVGSMGRRLLASLGRGGTTQAHAVEVVLDSLGLDTDVVTDPKQPGFVLLLVRNPFRSTAAAVGFAYWYLGTDLRLQGIVFHGTRNPRMRVWWTADTEWPYEWAIVTDNPNDGDRMNLLLLRLNQQATYWVLVQYENAGPDLGGPGDAEWANVNGAGPPELIVWTAAQADTSFEECNECPKLRLERLYVLRSGGYELYDSRLVPSPYATFSLFIRLLQQQNRTAAGRLLSDPPRIADAVAAGWAKRGRGIWTMEHSEVDEWPRWLAFKFTGPKGSVRYIVHFEFVEGRWLIRDWVTPKPVPIGKGVRP
jgi:hypothetical protein